MPIASAMAAWLPKNLIASAFFMPPILTGVKAHVNNPSCLFAADNPGMSMGKRIRSQRNILGLSRAVLAKRVGISETALWKIENDRTAILKSTTLMNLARELEIAPEYIRKGAGIASAPTPETQDEADLIGIFRAVSPKGRIAILGAARGILHSEPQSSKADPFKKPSARTPTNH